MKPTRAYDIFGNVALVKFPRGTSAGAKKKFAEKIMKGNKSVRTVLEKTGKFKGRLRKQETRWIAGEKTKEVLYRENGCVFRFNIDKTYFSPRLSNERKEIAEKIKGGDVLVMFAGVGPYSVVIAKHSNARRVYSNEINAQANEYGKQNIEMNKLKGKVIMLNGNIQDVATKVKRGLKVNNESVPKNFDVIVMPRPQLKESFLKEAFNLSKKGTRIFYYDFCKDDETDLIVNKIKLEAGKHKKKIKILNVKTAGEIAPYKVRVRVDFKLLN
jgi:tRNA (guanine37-N1)-methyltransferase